MEEEIDLILESAKESMDKAIDHLEKELTKIRAGKANPSMLDGILVEYYGSNTPLQQVANIGTLDARTLTVQPWEKATLEPIERAIINSNLGLNPQNNGEMILINIPQLTEERRKDLVKQAKAEAEHAKVSIRNARKEANDEVKKLQKDGLAEDQAKGIEEEIQELTDKYVAKVDHILELKEVDIMKV
ncbi:MAG: ribosome recycling factor [Flavobacteriales bacterium]|nr:ribosome recycling factor [Flavobacteriales bacterium]|tara:strand:- start:36864 stop:37427 length:564 start_codon:yes stop_codon:yes gene_type:complete